MWSIWACKETLPQRQPAFKQPRLTVISADRGPQAKPIRDRARRREEETSTGSADTEWQRTRRSRRLQGLPDPPAVPLETRMQLKEAGWQAPRRSRRPQGLPDPPAWPLHNQFGGLPEEVVEEDSAYSQEYPKLPSRPQKTPVVSKTTQKRPAVRTQVVSPPETNHSRSTQPHGSSYFLPRKISGRAATFLLDTGCTTNLLSRRLFDHAFLFTASFHCLDASVIKRFTRRS